MKPERYLLSALALCFTSLVFAQTPLPDLPPVFKDDVVTRVDILIPEDSLDLLLEPGNEGSNYHWHATFIFDNGEWKDTVNNVGFRLRGNTSRYADKKSFKVSFNTYVPGRKWEGLEKLNLNGEHNDPSVARAKICWDLIRWMEVPASRSNHVELYINGDFFGLYINVEHVDDEFVQLRYDNDEGNLFKCLYPADLAYKGANPNLYKEVFSGRRAYDLITNEDVDDYTDLAHFIDVLNNTPLNQLPCELEQVFNVDNYLKFIIADILTGNWDGPLYNKNNFYLYHNQATGQFEYIPYDLDNTLGIDWFGVNWELRDIYDWSSSSGPRPLYDRIMAVPAYRDRFSFYMNQFLQAYYVESEIFPYIEDLKSMISSAAASDPYRPQDYGFTFEDFLDSYDSPLPYFHTKIGVKAFIADRRDAALQQLDLNGIAPILTGVENNYPSSLQDISIKAKVEDDGTLNTVEVCYQVDGQNLTCVPMFDDGLHADGTAGDGVFGAIIPALNQAAEFEYYLQAGDNSGNESRKPVCGNKMIFIGSAAVPLVINEVMASNTGTYADEAGEYDDWIEIFSLSDVPIYLGNYHLSDAQSNPVKWEMPDLWIQPGQYLVFWADEDEAQGVFHTNFKLSADGEFLGLFSDISENYAQIDALDFGTQGEDDAFGRLPNGTGPFQAVFPTPGAENLPPDGTTDMVDRGVLVKIFPNPFFGSIHIDWSELSHQKAKIVLRNACGAFILEKEADGTGTSFDLNGLSDGLYFFEIAFENGETVCKKAVLHQ